VWIFDLDNTLHDAASRIFPSMHEQINDYLKRHLGVDDAGANAMRQDFWRRYGTTLGGLVRHHGTHPRDFLADIADAETEDETGERGCALVSDFQK